MPNLEGIDLQNFRTFKNRESLEFAPITLITGTNNAGKSSVFKAIQFLVHNFKDGIISESLDFKNMKHELGNFRRIYNRVSMETIKNSKISKNQRMYSRLSDFRKKNESHPNELPIFDEGEDLVFAFPIKFGGRRELTAMLEIRYELIRYNENEGNKEEISVSHNIKSIAIVKDGENLHWSNIIDYREYYDEPSDWQINTSLDLKRIIQLILESPLNKKLQKLDPNEKTEEYFTINLYERIREFKGIFFDLPFSIDENDFYGNFIENFIVGESLFSDYTKLSQDDKSKLLLIEQITVDKLLKGMDNSQSKILECFKHRFSSNIDGIEREIVKAELKVEKLEKKEKNKKEENIRALFENSLFRTTKNSELFTVLLKAIEKDFSNIVYKKIDSLKRVYFLPTTRGRNREWFIDEQNSEDIQIVQDFSSINLKSHQQIKNFVNFWIGKGELDEGDQEKISIHKGFNIGKELSVFRDEAIGLTKIFLVNFDGTQTPLVDLGYGVSQLLPIILKIAIIAQRNQHDFEYDYNNEHGYYDNTTMYFSPSTLLIEEPEANLHPSLQSKIAELLIDAASRFNIQFIIETHSEYLIYKFQEYIGKKIVSPSDVKMYYFNHPNDVKDGLKEKYINEVKIGQDGSIDYDKYFGKGFFDEQTNLKLSLLNIQRNRFLEDFDKIKEKLKKSSEILEDYDIKIEQLEKDLTTTISGKKKIELQLNKTRKDKDEKESELQELLKERDEKIDEFTAKTNYSKYTAEIKSIIDESKIERSKTLQYLSTGRYLLNNLDESADFAPVVIQYGRAVELEIINLAVGFKDSTDTRDLVTWCNDTNYIDKIKQVFNDLGLIINKDIFEPRQGKKIYLNNLKNFTKSSSNKSTFGQLTQIFELLHYISPTINIDSNYKSIPIFDAFSNYLKSIWSEYDKAELLFNTFRTIVDLRNCAGHTYSNSDCTNDIIDKRTAENYVGLVENIFRFL